MGEICGKAFEIHHRQCRPHLLQKSSLLSTLSIQNIRTHSFKFPAATLKTWKQLESLYIMKKELFFVMRYVNLLEDMCHPRHIVLRTGMFYLYVELGKEYDMPVTGLKIGETQVLSNFITSTAWFQGQNGQQHVL